MKAFFLSLVMLFVVLFSTAMLVGSYYFFSPAWLTYEGPVKVLSTSVRIGEAVPIRVTRCNTKGVRGVYDIDRWLIPVKGTPGPVVTLPPSLGISIEPGCHTGDAAISVIPPGTPLGRYFITGSARLRGPSLSNVVYWASEQFEVTK